MLIIGFKGTQLQSHEREWLRHPAVSGVILFTRNFDLARAGRRVDRRYPRVARPIEFLISVDQEGGPVQRFRDGFTRLPALGAHRRAASRAIRSSPSRSPKSTPG